METWRRLASVFLVVTFEEGKHGTFVRKIKLLAMTMGKMVLPFLACLLLMLLVGGMFHKDLTAGTEASLLAVSSNGMHGTASAKTGTLAFLSSWLSSLSSSSKLQTTSATKEVKDVSFYISSASSTPPSPVSEPFLWLKSLTSPLSSSSLKKLSAAPQTLHNESKETMSCPPSCFRPNPVCGVDGITYWCGYLDAECAGVEVDYDGFCDFDSKGTGVKGALAIQSLLLVHMVWLMLAAFLVFLGVI